MAKFSAPAVTQNGQNFRAFGADDGDFWFRRVGLASGFRRFPSNTSDPRFLVSRPPWGAPSANVVMCDVFSIFPAACCACLQCAATACMPPDCCSSCCSLLDVGFLLALMVAHCLLSFGCLLLPTASCSLLRAAVCFPEDAGNWLL
jgi:hypothetical protein